MYSTKILKQLLNNSAYFLSVVLLSVLFVSSGCNKNNYSTNPISKTPGSNDIFMQGMTFSPANKTISIGTTIKWTNQDSYTHTVTSGTPGSPSGLFDSGNLGPNGTFSFKFSQAGTFRFYCKIHSSMTGTITVQ